MHETHIYLDSLNSLHLLYNHFLHPSSQMTQPCQPPLLLMCSNLFKKSISHITLHKLREHIDFYKAHFALSLIIFELMEGKGTKTIECDDRTNNLT